ncbi:hypothetical protein KAM345_018820 [Aeromonas caviae]|nr:hypothetical protein KAM345_018820 [Aeromonas caviae]
MGGAYLRSRIKQAGKWDQETIVSFFLCQYCSGEYLRGQRLWVSIGNKDLGFDQRERVCDEVGKLSRADLVRFITQLRSRTSDRLILCSYGQGHEHDERITGQFIDDPRAFRLNAATFEG